MERVRDLIHKIGAQEAAGASPAALLATARALAAELEALIPRPALPDSSRVAVLLPPGHIPQARAAAPEPPPAAPAHPVPDVPTATNEVVESQPAPSAAAYEPLSEPVAASEPIEPQPPEPKTIEPKTPEPYSLRPPAFNPIEEVPTLAQQAPSPEAKREVFELHVPGESLNDRLRREEQELAHKLVDTPIRDLRKGIGVNDRFLFISELFRGDEAMYERSIKTINGFHILPEAEYWINRELKVKLGWPDTATVRHFDQLVRRRFS